MLPLSSDVAACRYFQILKSRLRSVFLIAESSQMLIPQYNRAFTWHHEEGMGGDGKGVLG